MSDLFGGDYNKADFGLDGGIFRYVEPTSITPPDNTYFNYSANPNLQKEWNAAHATYAAGRTGPFAVAQVAPQQNNPYGKPLLAIQPIKRFLRGADFSGFGDDDTGDRPPTPFTTFADSVFSPGYVQAYVPPAAPMPDVSVIEAFPKKSLDQFASSAFPDFLSPSIPQVITSGPAALNYQLTHDQFTAPVSYAKKAAPSWWTSAVAVVSSAPTVFANALDLSPTAPVLSPKVVAAIPVGSRGVVGPSGPRGGSTIAQDINAVATSIVSLFAPLAAAKAQKQQAAAARGPRQPQGRGEAASPALDTKTIAMIGGGVLLLGGIVYFVMKD